MAVRFMDIFDFSSLEPGYPKTDFWKIPDLSDRIRSNFYTATGSEPELTLTFFVLQPSEEKDFAKQIKHELVFYNPDNLFIVFILVCPFIRRPQGKIYAWNYENIDGWHFVYILNGTIVICLRLLHSLLYWQWVIVSFQPCLMPLSFHGSHSLVLGWFSTLSSLREECTVQFAFWLQVCLSESRQWECQY